jgi:hypothetical protein
MATMRVVQVPRPTGPLDLVERDMPEPGTGAVRIKVSACGICHSDSFTKEGTFPGIQYSRVPGHEFARSHRMQPPLHYKLSIGDLGMWVVLDLQGQLS